MAVKNDLQTLARRTATKVLSDYRAPRLKHSAELIDALDAAGALEGAGEWSGLAAEIAGALRANGADEFLRLRPIAKTIHPRIRSASRGYWAYLIASKLFTPTLQLALTESPIGKPLISPYYPWSSPLLVQHGYHFVRLLEGTGLDLAALRLVVEFGGGYGSFFRLLRNLGYLGHYLICDLPVMCALQHFYLRNLFPTGPEELPPGNLRWLSDGVGDPLVEETRQHRSSLFVATWSLSETPLKVRERVVPILGSFNYLLFAYQPAFAGCDNRAYFASLEQTLTQFAWQHFECPVYRKNFYLIGVRREPQRDGGS